MYTFGTLTQSTAVQFHSHGDMPVPGPGMYTYISGFDGWAEPVHDHKISFGITLEYLEIKKNAKRVKLFF